MREKPTLQAGPTEQFVKDIPRATRKQHSAEEKRSIVLDGLRGGYNIADLALESRLLKKIYRGRGATTHEIPYIREA